MSEEGWGWEGGDVPIRIDRVNNNLEVVMSMENVVCVRRQVPDALLLCRCALVVIG
jgi:hypothetical protein